jgi:hypothetical protein
VRTAESDGGLYSRPFLGPDGTGTTFYETAPAQLWSGHFNDRWIQYRTYFNSSSTYDSSFLKNVTITYNNLPIAELQSPADKAVLTTNTPTLRWQFTDYDSASQSMFQVLIDNDTTFNDVYFDSGEQVSSFKQWNFPDGTAYNTLPEGTWYWKVRTRDNDGDWGSYSDVRSLMVDTVVPGSAIDKPENLEFYRYLSRLSGTAIDPAPGSGLDRVELCLSRQGDNNTWNGLKWENALRWFEAEGTGIWTYDTGSIEWTSGESYTLMSRAVDNATNTQTATPEISFMIDFEWPTSKITNPKPDSFVTELDSIEGTAEDGSGSGIFSVELAIQRLEDELYWTGLGWESDLTWLPTVGTTVWSYDSTAVPWTSDKWYRLETRASDLTDNTEFEGPSRKFMFDNSAPGFSFSINKDASLTNSPKVSLSISASDQGSGLDMLALSTDGTFWSNWQPFAEELSYDLPGGDGIKNVYLKIMDHAGNIAEPRSKSIMLDTTPPENVSITINNGAEHTNELTVNLAITGEDKLSGIDRISLGYDGVEWSDWEPFRENMQFPLQQKNGRKKIWLRVSDIAGNVAKALDDIILDTEPPDPVIIFINRNDDTTDSVDVKLTIHAEDKITGTVLMAFSDDGTTWTEWEKYVKTSSRPYTLTAGDGNKTVYFKVKDGAGNIADAVSDTIILDTSIPEIEEQEEQAVIADVESNSFIFLLIIVAIVIAAISIAAMSITRRKRRIKAEREAVDKPAAAGMITKPAGPALPAPAAPQAPQLPAAATGVPQPAQPGPQLALPPAPQPGAPDQTPQSTTAGPAPQTLESMPEFNILFDPDAAKAETKTTFPCTQCGEPLEKVSEGRFYCYTCQKYE